MKTFAALALGMLLASTSLARTPPVELPRHEVHAGFGDASLIFELRDVLVTFFSMGAVTYGELENSYQFTVGYQHRFSPRYSAGITGSYADAEREMRIVGYPVDRNTRRIFTLFVDGRAHWLVRSRSDLYSGLGVGLVTLTDEYENIDDYSATGIGFQVTALGYRFGRSIGAFVEVGAGWNGFVKLGASGRF